MQDHFHSLLPGIATNDCICRACESNAIYKPKAKRLKTDISADSTRTELCDLAKYSMCQNKRYRSLQLNQNHFVEVFGIKLDKPKDEIISIQLCQEHRFQYFKYKHKCVICSKPFTPDQKRYYFPESVLNFAELYLASIPGSDAPTEGKITQSSTVCSGCDYAVRKFMVDNFRSSGGSKNYATEIENIKQIWTHLAQSDKSGLSCCILACCDSFLEDKPILLADLFNMFLDKCPDSEKSTANQRTLLQKVVEIFQNSVTIVTDDYKRMGTMIKRTDNNDNKTIHTALYNEFSKVAKNTEHDCETVNTNNILVKASCILRDRLIAQKNQLKADSLDIENFDPYHFIVDNCDPMLFNFIRFLQGESVFDFAEALELDKIKSKGLSCLNIISCILFSSDLSCRLPLPMLISDVVDKYTNSSSDCLRILNQFGICYSKTSLKEYQNSVIKRKNEVGVQLSLDSFTICSVDNINKRSSYAAVKSSDVNRGFDGTSVQLVEPMPESIKWSANEVNQELALCTTLSDNEGITYKKLNIGTDLSLFKSISAICFSSLRHSERDQNGNILNEENSLEDDRICFILSRYANFLVDGILDCTERDLSQIRSAEEYFYLAVSFAVNIPIQVFEVGETGNIDLIFQSDYQKMGQLKSPFILDILKDNSGKETCYSPIFTNKTYFNDDLITSEFLTAFEEKDLDTEFLSFKFFCMSAVSTCNRKLGSQLNRQSKTPSLVQHNDLATQLSVLNLNPSCRKKSVNSPVFDIPDFETVFLETPNEMTASTKISKKAFAYCIQKHIVENNLSGTIHPNFLQYLELTSTLVREKSKVKFLYVLDENADNRETMKLTLDKLYSDIGIHKTLNYLVVVGDAKTYDHLVHLKNEFPDKLEWLLPFIGDWHTLKNYQLMLMKIYLDAGLRELVHLFHQGILAKVVSEATGFDKTHTFLTQVWEALYRFELQMFFLSKNSDGLKSMNFDLDSVCKFVKDYIENVSKSNLDETPSIELENLGDSENEFGIFCERLCAENKTWKFWHNFIHVDCLIYFKFYISLRTGDWNLRNLCLKHICRLAQVTDSRFYSRLLAQNLVDIHRFPDCVKKHFENGGFVMNVSGRNNHSQGLDEGHESCINKDVKAALNTCSEKSIAKAVRYVPARANCLRKLKEVLGISRPDPPVFSASVAALHEENVLALKQALGKSYLFAIYLEPARYNQTTNVHHLFSLKEIDKKQSENMLNLKKIGSEHLKCYIEKCKQMKAYALCKSLPLKLTGSFSKKVTVSSVKRELKDVQTQNKMYRIQIDWCSKHNIIMDDMKQYLNNPLPRAISTIDGLPFISTKSRILSVYKKRYPEAFESSCDISSFDSVILDGMFLIYHTPPFRSFKTFSDYILYLYAKYVTIHFENDVKNVHVVFDEQDSSQFSPKSILRERRDIKNDKQPVIIPGDISVEDPLPRVDWRDFLKARENKQKVVHLISEQFLVIATSILQSDQTLYVGGGFAESFIAKKVTCDEITDCDILKSNALEGDSKVWLHLFRCQGLKCLVYSPDNDTYHIGLPLIEKYSEKKVYVALDSTFVTLLNLNTLSCSIRYDIKLGRSLPDVLYVIQMLYASTGCDYVSFFKGHGKTSFFDTLLKDSEFISAGRNYKGTLSDFKNEIESGFLSFLRLIGCEYFPTCSNEFKDNCPDERPETVFNHLLDQNKTDLENHTIFINALREALFKRCDAEHNLPSVEALHFHWLRSCWVCKVWSQADKNDVVYPPLDHFGWAIKDNKLSIIWDTEENIKKVESKIKLWTQGCNCATGCKTNRCGCRQKQNSCCPGCKCGSNCENLFFDSTSNINSDVASSSSVPNFSETNEQDDDNDGDSDGDSDMEFFPDCDSDNE